MLSDKQQAAYDRDGYLVVRGAISAGACERMCNRLWKALGETHGIRRDAPETWTRVMPRGLQKLSNADAFAEIASPAFLAVVDDLIGPGTWDPPRHWGGLLATFPTPGPWDVPAGGWHLDHPARGRHGPRFAVKALCLLARLEPRGGGTLLLERSHHVTTRLAENGPPGDAGHSTDVRRKLAREHPWFGELVSKKDTSDRVQRFMVDGTEVGGMRLRVVEFIGDAGDVVFFHPWLFHNASPNCREAPRLMAGQTLRTRAGLKVFTREGSA